MELLFLVLLQTVTILGQKISLNFGGFSNNGKTSDLKIPVSIKRYSVPVDAENTDGIFEQKYFIDFRTLCIFGSRVFFMRPWSKEA